MELESAQKNYFGLRDLLEQNRSRDTGEGSSDILRNYQNLKHRYNTLFIERQEILESFTKLKIRSHDLSIQLD